MQEFGTSTGERKTVGQQWVQSYLGQISTVLWETLFSEDLSTELLYRGRVYDFSEGDIHFDRSLQLVMRSRYSLDIVAETNNQETQAPRAESWRIQVYYAGRPRGVNTLSSEPWTKVL